MLAIIAVIVGFRQKLFPPVPAKITGNTTPET